MDVYAEDDLNDSVMRPLDMLSRLDQVNKGQRGFCFSDNLLKVEESCFH